MTSRHRAQKLMKRYGLTEADYERIMMEQGGGCAVCGRTSEIKLVVDHCHTSGAIRGLLCHNCNIALGMVGDDPTILRRMIGYLHHTKANA